MFKEVYDFVASFLTRSQTLNRMTVHSAHTAETRDETGDEAPLERDTYSMGNKGFSLASGLSHYNFRRKIMNSFFQHGNQHFSLCRST